mmetsp:Transcript_27862/g.63024  ORF Transcript_27862/g.63024 Transcript_27862/m.63024 type:complete len:256 (+) Transcript_27862:1627-2394(+)
MRHGAGVLGVLVLPQELHVLDPLDEPRVEVGREFLVAEDGQALFERQLEPVAAGDSVPRPVVEVLVRDDALYSLVVAVCRRRWLGEHACGVEDIEALVLHGPHVEVVDSHDVVHVQVVLEPEPLFVPLHRVLQTLHRPVKLVHVGVLAEDFQRHLPSRLGREAVFDGTEVSRDHREEVGGLRERILPLSKVPALAQVALGHEVAIGQEDGTGLLVCLDPHRVPRHDVRAVEHGGDAAEALCLALRAIHAGGLVEA